MAMDVCYALWARRVSQGDALQGAAFAAALMVFGGYATISYVKDRRLLVAAVLGAFAGTYLAVSLD
jgi:hypothetical protein